MSPEFIFQILASITSALAVGIGVYSGIKSDLATTHEKAVAAKESASEAHRRIDNLLTKD
jgi:hypothetical protein